MSCSSFDSVANAEAVRLEDRRSEDERDGRELGDGCVGEDVGHEERQAERHEGHRECVTNERRRDRADREAIDPSTGATGRRGVGRQRPRVFHADSMAATTRGLYGSIVRARIEAASRALRLANAGVAERQTQRT